MQPDLRKPLISGNWKMNINHKEATLYIQKLAFLFQDHKYDPNKVETLLFVPFTDLRSVQTLVESDNIPLAYGGEDVSEQEKGAFTGDISISMLKELGSTYVLVGHSERRKYHKETAELILKKAQVVIDAGLIPVVCVGDVSADEDGTAEDFEFAATQTFNYLKKLKVDSLDKIVIAWEPAAAIGSGSAVEPETIGIITKLIRQRAAEATSEAEANKLRILYGGSVNKNLIHGIMAETDCDGTLIGGASLAPETFESIIQITQSDI